MVVIQGGRQKEHLGKKKRDRQEKKPKTLKGNNRIKNSSTTNKGIERSNNDRSRSRIINQKGRRPRCAENKRAREKNPSNKNELRSAVE